jgi:hypothetical protein
MNEECIDNLSVIYESREESQQLIEEEEEQSMGEMLNYL